MARSAEATPQGRDGERGSIAVFTAICVVALVALIGLVVDGYGRVREVERADALATEAARAGAQAIDPAQAVPGRALVADPQAARAAAQNYLRANGAAGAAVVDADGKRLAVHVQLTYKAKFWPADLAVSGSGHASLVHGVTVEEP
ncbi:pilus assembly protein TadG-related protein [Streptomyces lydicus]|uniref:pilus assembly protein TadG-related protein n=1 Tax=Streptomyces lydicus TaxID=47763 RepID=UPI0036E16B5C